MLKQLCSLWFEIYAIAVSLGRGADARRAVSVARRTVTHMPGPVALIRTDGLRSLTVNFPILTLYRLTTRSLKNTNGLGSSPRTDEFSHSRSPMLRYRPAPLIKSDKNLVPWFSRSFKVRLRNIRAAPCRLAEIVPSKECPRAVRWPPASAPECVSLARSDNASRWATIPARAQQLLIIMPIYTGGGRGADDF
ncbi:hypothetical protein EVAR_37382_1 [Eumeta japonica]|uniref:Uncharacterized protein n=1 Tax=Eumeta variegata TaxID=151549 RepID=A0A4C1ZSC6_EUMVA|nr:hypothetical protein EVAR_37382_1 [Eumeta japonica]